MKNVLTALSNIASTFTAKMAEQEAISKKGFRHITDNVNVVNSNVGEVAKRVDSIDAKVDAILAELKAGKVAPVQEAQIRNNNEHRTTRQYNSISESLIPIKKTAKGEAVFGICEDCGLELTSNLVVGYCKANGFSVYCPKCQKKHGIDSASRGIGKNARRTPAPSPSTTSNKGQSTPKVDSSNKEFIQVRVCGCCGEHVKYTSAEAFNESMRKAKALGLPKYIHGKCAKAMLDSREVEAAQAPVSAPVEEAVSPIVNVLKDTEHAFNVLVDDVMTSEQLATLKIAELRKYADGKGYSLAFDGNEWNRNKASFVKVEEVATVDYADTEVEVPMVAESEQLWIPMTADETDMNKEVAEQFSLVGEDGTRLF